MTPDRFMTTFRELVRAEFPTLLYLGVWEYSVTSATSSTFSGRATSSDCPLPDLAGVESRPGVAGATFTPAEGSRVLVAFANADPKRPVVVSWDGTEPDGDIELGGSRAYDVAEELGRVVRYGDVISVPLGTVGNTVAVVVTGLATGAPPVTVPAAIIFSKVKA